MTPGSDAEKNYIINELDKIEQKMLKLFSSAYVDAIGLGEVRTAIKNCTEQFAFDNFPAAKTKLKTILSTLKESTQKTVIESQKNVANIALKTSAQGLMKNFEHKKKDLDLVENISEKSIDQAREASSESANGFKLSSNVWDLDKYATKEIEAIVQAGIRQGKTVEDIARSVTPYLKNPGLENAEPEFQKIKTPQGVFASAYRNALRMARTEVVRAYDEAEWNSYQNDPLIVGFEVRLSNNHTVKIRGKKKPLKDICDQLQGKYPKTFKFTGWHPQCRCTMIPIPIGADELGAFADAEDNGTEFKSKNAVDELPENFKNWVEENSDRIDGSVSLPYFISENQAIIDSILHPELQSQQNTQSAENNAQPQPQPQSQPQEEVVEPPKEAAWMKTDATWLSLSTNEKKAFCSLYERMSDAGLDHAKYSLLKQILAESQNSDILTNEATAVTWGTQFVHDNVYTDVDPDVAAEAFFNNVKYKVQLKKSSGGAKKQNTATSQGGSDENYLRSLNLPQELFDAVINQASKEGGLSKVVAQVKSVLQSTTSISDKDKVAYIDKIVSGALYRSKYTDHLSTPLYLKIVGAVRNNSAFTVSNNINYDKSNPFENNAYSEERKAMALKIMSKEESMYYFNDDVEKTKSKTNGGQQEGIEEYTGDFYAPINTLLRGGDTDGFDEDMLEGGEIFAKAAYGYLKHSTINADFWVVRQITKRTFSDVFKISYNDRGKLSIGTTIKDEAFTSTCTDFIGQRGFGPVRLEIYCPRGTSGGYAEPFTKNEDEDEMILQAGTEFRVIGVDINNDVYRLEVISQKPSKSKILK